MRNAPEERKRFLGFPLGESRSPPEERPGPRHQEHEETARVLGFPVGMFGSVDRGWFRTAVHPIRSMKRRNRNRLLGPLASEGDRSGGTED